MIKPSPFQVRSSITGIQLEELKASMNEVGQAVPIKVRPVVDGVKPCPEHGLSYLISLARLEDIPVTETMKNNLDLLDAGFAKWPWDTCDYCTWDLAEASFGWEIVYGHRRFEVAKMLMWEEIEAVIEELTDEQAMLQGLAENVQRDDLEPIDEAIAYKRLQDDFGWTQERIANEVGKTQFYISTSLELLGIDKSIQKKIKKHGSGPSGMDKGTLSKYHVQEAQRVGDYSISNKVLKKAAKEGLTVFQTREVAQAIKEANTDKLKQQLIEAPFSEHIHDPERVKKLVEERGGIDPLTDKEKPKPKQQEKAVADFLRYIRQMRWWLEDFEKAIDNWQVSPEGRLFVSERLKPMRSDIDRILTKLEK